MKSSFALSLAILATATTFYLGTNGSLESRKTSDAMKILPATAIQSPHVFAVSSQTRWNDKRDFGITKIVFDIDSIEVIDPVGFRTISNTDSLKDGFNQTQSFYRTSQNQIGSGDYYEDLKSLRFQFGPDENLFDASLRAFDELPDLGP